MKHTLGSLSQTARLYVIGVILAGAAIWVYSSVDLVRHPVGWEWLILVALTVGSGWATLAIPGMPISFSISDTFNIAAALLFGPSAGAVSAALDGLVLTSRFSNDKRSLDRILFNMAAPTIAIWVAAQVFVALGGNREPLESPLAALRLLALLALFGAIDFGLMSGIVAVAVSFERRAAVLSIWREHLSGVWLTYFGGVFGAMLLMVLTRSRTLEILILIVPLPVILYVTFRHAVGRIQDQMTHLGNVNRVYVGAIEALAHAVDAKDQVTHDHTRRVQDQTLRLARALNVDDEGDLQAIRAAALLHDVGKLAIPEHILNKPGRLSPAEYEIMKRHAPIGAEILSVIGFPYAVAPIVRHHHENWDGTGYPDGVSGDQIPIGSRILAVVDCFDALTSDRPYRPRMDDRDALQILSDRRGNMYDPHVVDAFFLLHQQTAASPAEEPPASTEVSPVAASSGTSPEQTEAQRADLDLLMFFQLGRSLGEAAPSTRLGDILWSHLRHRVPAEAFVLYVYERASDAVVPVHTCGLDEGLAKEPVPLGERLSGWVAATGQTVMNSDARLDFDEPGRAESSLRSALAVRVMTPEEEIAGVLSLYAEPSNAFDESHRRLVEAVARVVAANMSRLSRERASTGPRNGTHVFQNLQSV